MFERAIKVSVIEGYVCFIIFCALTPSAQAVCCNVFTFIQFHLLATGLATDCFDMLMCHQS